uniref:Uncharacterized protein n=1 Tax=Arundo donax TaxID=35708 RepID=A0A0A9C0Z2_ARUDO
MLHLSNCVFSRQVSCNAVPFSRDKLAIMPFLSEKMKAHRVHYFIIL